MGVGVLSCSGEGCAGGDGGGGGGVCSCFILQEFGMELEWDGVMLLQIQ